MTKPAPDPIEELADEFVRVYQLLAGKVEPGQTEGGGRRSQPASRPPLQVLPVSHMDEGERFLRWWIAEGRFALQPTRRIDITTQTGATCPYCAGPLVAWLYGDNPEPPEVVCLNRQADIHARAAPEGGAPWRWERPQWPRLGVLAGVRDDARFTTLRGQATTG